MEMSGHMKSMTGFGRGVANDVELGIGFRAEISSVNRKQFEVKVNLPREVSMYEPKLRMMVSERVSRGSLILRVDLERSSGSSPDGSSAGPLRVNEAVLSDVLAKCRGIQERFDIPGKLEISHVLSLPGVLEADAIDFGMPQIDALLGQAVSEAIANMLKMRETEGVSLRRDIDSRISTLSEIVDGIEPLAKSVPDLQKERLLQRLRDSGLSVEYDDERLLREFVIYADKSDVSEEITRLRSHFEHFRKFLDGRDTPVGRSLDFMIQEISREATTLGNKAPGIELSPLVVQFKTELEKIREQVQNVE